LTHPAVPLALGLALTPVMSRRLLLVGVIASVLPDLDVVAFSVGIGYAHPLGHRGFTHSLAFAVVLALLALAFHRPLRVRRAVAFAFVLVATASHGLLDMLTNGGLGIALLWPFSEARYFFPLQPIEVSPLSVRRVFSAAGIPVFASELRYVWLPCALAGFTVYAMVRSSKAGGCGR
jgi:inner membrane protein